MTIDKDIYNIPRARINKLCLQNEKSTTLLFKPVHRFIILSDYLAHVSVVEEMLLYRLFNTVLTYSCAHYK